MDLFRKVAEKRDTGNLNQAPRAKNTLEACLPRMHQGDGLLQPCQHAHTNGLRTQSKQEAMVWNTAACLAVKDTQAKRRHYIIHETADGTGAAVDLTTADLIFWKGSFCI